MKSIKRYIIEIIMLIGLCSVTAYAAPYFEEHAPPSFADSLHLKHSQNPIHPGWLPRLTGLPDETEVREITQQIMDIIGDDKNKDCASINLHLRTMVFQHYSIYQRMVNAHQVYFDEKIAHQWAHILAMILKESSGDSTNITDMEGHSIATDDSRAKLRHWAEILKLRKDGPIQFNIQTNFGLTQTSADRLSDAFRLSKEQKYDVDFLEGRDAAETPQTALNTAIAIRRLIWFYQGFAQGRLLESDARIHQKDIHKPEFSDRYQKGLDMALLYCGTRFMFRGHDLESKEETKKLRDAMASIAYCDLGNPQTGYGMNEVEEQCFAEWVTLCPALNIDIATLTPLSYYATRGATPVCKETFMSLINKKPDVGQ